MATRIAGIVLRTRDRHVTAQFYARLGLATHEHQHGGPKHFEIGPLSPDYVVEIYQGTEIFDQDAIMLEVDSIADAIAVAAEFGISPKTDIRGSESMKFIYITDPDGRDVMLIEKK